MVKKTKNILIIIVVILIIGALAFGGGILFQNKYGDSGEPSYSSDTIGNEIKDISEFAAMDYRYTNVGKFENQLEFYGWDVPFTSKSFIITYDGSMKLGVDGDKVAVDVSGNKINITLPEISILSHEIYEDSIEVMDQSKNIFNQIQVEDYTGFANDRKKDMEEKIKTNDVYTQAEERVKSQLKAMLTAMPGLSEKYTVHFV